MHNVTMLKWMAFKYFLFVPDSASFNVTKYIDACPVYSDQNYLRDQCGYWNCVHNAFPVRIMNNQSIEIAVLNFNVIRNIYITWFSMKNLKN